MLKITKGYRPIYTRREFIQNKYSNELESIEQIFKVFVEIQNATIEMLSGLRGNLPVQADYFNPNKDYPLFLEYIYNLSLYSFVHKVSEILSRDCTSLADAINEADKDAEETALDKLHIMRSALCEIPFDNILDTQVNNMFTLERYADMCEKGLYFKVLNSWWFRDILPCLDLDNRNFRSLYVDSINQEIPSASNIGNLVDDEEMQLIY